MKKILLVAILVCFLNGCAKYQPILDTKGRSKFETSNASEISNDLILCEKLAKNNTTFLILFFLPHKNIPSTVNSRTSTVPFHL